MKGTTEAGTPQGVSAVAHEFVDGRRQKVLLGSLFANFAVLFGLYNGVIGRPVAPIRSPALDPGNKASNFSFIMFVTLLFTIFATPLAGARYRTGREHDGDDALPSSSLRPSSARSRSCR